MFKESFIYLQYAGGKSTPHEFQDRSGGWGGFFGAQCLVLEPLKGGSRQVVMKTSEISPTGVMIIEPEKEGRPKLRNFGDLSREQTIGHLRLVGKVMTTLGRLCPEAAFRLWHVNNTAEVLCESPKDLGHPLNAPVGSQTLAVMHSHCDALSGEKFIKVSSLLKLRGVHRQRLIETGAEEADKELKNFMEVKRKIIRPRVFYRLARSIWEKEVVPELLNKFPDLFEEVETHIRTLEPPRAPLPRLALQLKTGLDSFNSPRFAEATQLVHQRLISKWEEIANLIRNPNLLNNYLENHPWAERYRERFVSLARIIEIDREKIPNKTDWLHPSFNYTMGVVQWQKDKAIFFVDPLPDTRGGVESVNIHSVREKGNLTSEEKTQRVNFRAALIRSLRKLDPNLVIGLEGRHTLQKA